VRVVTVHETRFVDLDGAHNFRDLGGLPTIDGGETRWGVMYRSDALHHLEPADVEHLLELGMRTVIDLRSSVELERTGRGPLEATSIGWVHAPLTHVTHGEAAAQMLPPALAEGDLGRHYVESLAERTETLAEVITHLATPEYVPAVFHCTAGKDRTGMVTALVLSLVGVADDVIVEDYTLTDERMTLVMERIRASGDFPAQLAPVAASVARAEATSMVTFLDALARTYGGAAGWARAAGLGDDVIASLSQALVTPRTPRE
jgi:protein tyrosine/serine phosphatase